MTAAAELRTVHLVDASPYIFRAYFAMQSPILGPDGAEVGATLGFANFLLRYLDTYAPTHIGVAFDESLTTSFRNELYPDYKAQRELPPEELVEQLAACRETAEVLGVTTVADERYEADDFIATWRAKLHGRGRRIVVVSPDKDLMQLVDDEVELFDLAREQRYGPQQVRVKLGVDPAQVPDFLGLAGDSVDNIPGVPGVGPKSAAALLGEYANLEEVYDDLDGVASLAVRGARSLAERLREHRELAFLSRKLATLSTRAPLPKGRGGIGGLRRRGVRRDEARELFTRLGFERLLRRVQA